VSKERSSRWKVTLPIPVIITVMTRMKYERKKGLLRNGNTTYMYHVFAETTHVVAAPPSFAWVVPALRWLHIQVSSKSIQGFWSHRELKIALLRRFGYWLILVQQLGTTAHAVIPVIVEVMPVSSARVFGAGRVVSVERAADVVDDRVQIVQRVSSTPCQHQPDNLTSRIDVHTRVSK